MLRREARQPAGEGGQRGHVRQPVAPRPGAARAELGRAPEAEGALRDGRTAGAGERRDGARREGRQSVPQPVPEATRSAAERGDRQAEDVRVHAEVLGSPSSGRSWLHASRDISKLLPSVACFLIKKRPFIASTFTFLYFTYLSFPRLCNSILFFDDHF